MGCTAISKIKKLEEYKKLLEKDIENYESYIKLKDSKIEELKSQLTQEENEIRANKHSYTQQQKIDKAKKIMPILIEKFRMEWLVNYTRKFTETLKLNLEMVEKKIQQMKLHRNIKKANEIAKEFDDDTEEEIKININMMMNETEKTKKEIELMNAGNKAINKEMGMPDMDSYLKNLFN